MVDENTQGTPVPPQQPQAQPQPAYQAPAPNPYPAPVQPPVLMELSGGMKFGWLVIGVLMGLSGILIAWLANAGNVDKVRSDAVKFSVIGLVINIVFWLIMVFAFGALFASIASMASYYYY